MNKKRLIKAFEQQNRSTILTYVPIQNLSGIKKKLCGQTKKAEAYKVSVKVRKIVCFYLGFGKSPSCKQSGFLERNTYMKPIDVFERVCGYIRKH